jgi:hypothetical protein
MKRLLLAVLLKTDSSPDMKEEFTNLELLFDLLLFVFLVMMVSLDFAMSEIILASAESIEEDKEPPICEVKPLLPPLWGEPSQVSLIILEMSSYWSITSDFCYWS